MSVQPTILIGYGDYGLDLLRRLLLNASDRGVLVWSRDAQVPGSSGPQLRDLALFHCFPQNRDHRGSNPLEEDLYRQIQSLEDPAKLPAEIVRAKDRLLGAGRFASEGNTSGYSLDVIVAAHPASSKDLSNLRNSMEPVMDELARDRNFVSPGPGGETLNFIQILDFDKYWESSEFRERHYDVEVSGYVARWEERHQQHKPSFSRIYFADSNPGGGYRAESPRVHEAVLFLELILFEGQRSDEKLRHLAQRYPNQSPIASTFGVRVIERQRGLMRRLSSAYFSYSWLRYLAGSEAPHDRPPGVEISRLLAPYLEGAMISDAEIAPLVQKCERELEGAVPDFMQVSLGRPRWSDSAGADPLARWLRSFERNARARIETVRLEVAQQATDLFDNRTRDRFSKIKADTLAAVTSALQHPQYPTPVGRVIEELQRFASALEDPDYLEPDAAQSSAFGSENFEKLRRVYSDFLWFKSQQLNPEEALKRLWIWPVAGAAFFTPIVVAAANELPIPENPSGLMNLLMQSRDLLAGLLPAWIFILVLSTVLALAAARKLRQRCERGVDIYIHEGQGLLRAAAAEMLQSLALRDYIQNRVRATMTQRANRFKRAVVREITFVIERLHLRQSEMIWLSNQMRQFCVRHGVDPEDPLATYRPPAGDANVYTYWIEQRQDFRRMIEQNPLSQSRFQSLQGSTVQDDTGLFAHWQDRYAPSFLYPIQFIDWLSRQTAFEQNEVSPSKNPNEQGSRTQEIVDALSKIGLAPLGFVFSDGGHFAEPERFCLLPDEWRGQSDVVNKIRSIGLSEEQTGSLRSTDRAYLLRYRHGVAANLLRRTTE